MLTFAIIGGSSIGTLSNYLPASNSLVRNTWRYGILVIYLALPTLVEVIYRRNEINLGALFSFKSYIFLILTLVCQILWTFGLFYGSATMIQSHAYVLNNVHGLFIVAINATFLGIKCVRSEYIGIAFAIGGCVCMMLDPSAERTDGVQSSLMTYMICFGSAIFGALYFLMNAKNVKSLPICLLLFVMNVHNFVICGLLAKFTDPNKQV